MPCPASTRLMRKSTSGQQTTLVSGTSVLVVPFSETRVSLVISNGSVIPVFLSLGTAAVLDQGIRLDEWNATIKLTLGDDGQLVRGPLYAIAGGVNAAVTYWDAHLPPVIEG